jgi:hypothetical protein
MRVTSLEEAWAAVCRVEAAVEAARTGPLEVYRAALDASDAAWLRWGRVKRATSYELGEARTAALVASITGGTGQWG